MAYQSKHTGAAIDAAIDVVVNKENAWDEKQDKLTGQAGQLVIFDENGNPVAQDMSELVGDSSIVISSEEPTEGDVWIDVDDAYSDTISANMLTFDDGATLQQKYDDGELRGLDGYTPQKGTDYWTEEDKTEIVASVLAALPAAEEASF